MSRSCLLACVSILALSGSVGFAADPFPPDALPGAQIGGGLPFGYECSGAAWHTGLEKLFTIHDGGTVSSLNADGTGVHNWSLPGDLEGICVADPGSDFIYVGVENPDSIREFNVTTGSVTRTFDLTTWMTGPDNLGLEALTFVPDAGDPEGGLFYAGLQSEGKIYSFRLPLVSNPSSTTVTHVSTIAPASGRSDISGLHYDVDGRVLYTIYDSANRLRATKTDGTFLAEWQLPGSNQEGVTLAAGHLYIAEDYLNSGQIVDYSPFPALSDSGIMTWDGTDGADWAGAHWTPGHVTPNPGKPMAVNSGTVIVSTDLTTAPGPAASLDIASGPAGATVNIASTGKLLVTDDVNLGAGGTLDVSGVLVAGEINVTGGLLTNNGAGLIGSARLTVSGGVVSATHPITVTESLTIGSEPVITVSGAPLGIRGDDLLDNPVRELTLQGGEVTIHSGGSAIDMPETDLIVVDDTLLDLGNATSATFDELVFGTGRILAIESDSPTSVFFRGISGSGELDGTFLRLIVTGFLSPGDTGRVLTIVGNTPEGAVADYIAMLDALGFTMDTENVAMACLDGDSYPVSSPVPEPATLGLLVLGSMVLTRRRQRGR